MTPAVADPGFALYVHWPFCLAKCPYCDFNSHVREQVDQARWRAGLLRELDYFADLTPGRRLTSIFFGGGTPSLMPSATVAAVLQRAADRWGFVDGIEVTLEANPTSVEAGRFRDFRAAGVNRVSLGIQALNDTDLRALGRQHSAAEALAAIRLARASFDRFSFDLIYARPGQTLMSWRQELQRALDEAVGHLSLYQLTIEEGTRFHTLHARGELVLPDEDVQADLYALTQDLLEAAGLPAYEISNHARPGEESRHNLTYWRYGDYVGVGPGAHGRLTLLDAGPNTGLDTGSNTGKVGTWTHRAPEIWLERVESSGSGAKPFEPIPPQTKLTELLMMGLRLREGVPLARITAESGLPLDQALPMDRVHSLIRHGMLTLDADRLTATAAGRQRLNGVLAGILSSA